MSHNPKKITYKLKNMTAPIVDHTFDGYNLFNELYSKDNDNFILEYNIKALKNTKYKKNFIQEIVKQIGGDRTLVKILYVVHQVICLYLVHNIPKSFIDEKKHNTTNTIMSGINDKTTNKGVSVKQSNKLYPTNYSDEIIHFKEMPYIFSTSKVLGFCPFEPLLRISQLLPFLALTDLEYKFHLPDIKKICNITDEEIKVPIKNKNNVNSLIVKYDSDIKKFLIYYQKLCKEFVDFENKFPKYNN